ncbi:MAG: PQQ-dependent sugar dehydrogenase [Myxococcales bacterium]|nr:PQQ-dependent sugar dehydrogenase [Myxococcales bacterium]
MKKWGILSASVLACALLAAYLTAGSRVDDTTRLPSHQTEPTSSSSPETTPWNSTTEFRNTNRYNVVLEMVQGPFQGWFGGLASYENGVIVATRTGRLFFVSPREEIRRLPYRVPINWHAFSTRFAGHLGEHKRFSVKGLLAIPREGRIALIASHHYWFEEDRCYVLRVSRKIVAESDLLGAEPGPRERGWETLFETSPCIALPRAKPTQFYAHEAGGQLLLLDENMLLLSVGHEGFDGVTDPVSFAQDPSASYGKTLAIDLDTGAAEIFTSGHRNPQGLYLAPDGRVWSTEHGPRGGDELNLLRKGGDYGWPEVTYGTTYESLSWPVAKRPGEYEGYLQPIYAWVPSPGISSLVGVEKSLFEQWRGDLLVGSLRGGMLFRVRVREGRAVLTEPIPIGWRIRDLVEMRDGTIAMKTDSDRLIFMRPVPVLPPLGDTERDRSAEETGATDAVGDVWKLERGELLSLSCLGCHTLGKGEPSGIGSNLWGVFGRDIAAHPGYDYSEALLAKSGRWNETELDAYLKDPEGYASGTTMDYPGMSSREDRRVLIDYFRALAQ